MVGIRLVDAHEEHGRSRRVAVVTAGERWSTSQRTLVRLVGELDASGEWTVDGAPTCAHWVASAIDVEVCTAREWVRIGRALSELPAVAEAFEEGRLSYSKVRALTRIATPDNEIELCALAERVPASRFTHALASWLAHHESPAETEARHAETRYLGWRLDIDGMIVGSFRLSPASAARITGPVDARVSHNRPDVLLADASADASIEGRTRRWPSLGKQRVDALVDLVSGGGATIATEIVLHVRSDGSALDDGTPIAGSVVERIAPQSFLRALIHDAERKPINASGRQRHPTTRQRRVVKERDRACVDCGATEFLQYDHEPDFELSHRTVVDELRLRCPACHHARHRGNGNLPRDA